MLSLIKCSIIITTILSWKLKYVITGNCKHGFYDWNHRQNWIPFNFNNIRRSPETYVQYNQENDPNLYIRGSVTYNNGPNNPTPLYDANNNQNFFPNPINWFGNQNTGLSQIPAFNPIQGFNLFNNQRIPNFGQIIGTVQWPNINNNFGNPNTWQNNRAPIQFPLTFGTFQTADQNNNNGFGYLNQNNGNIGQNNGGVPTEIYNENTDERVDEQMGQNYEDSNEQIQEPNENNSGNIDLNSTTLPNNQNNEAEFNITTPISVINNTNSTATDIGISDAEIESIFGKPEQNNTKDNVDKDQFNLDIRFPAN